MGKLYLIISSFLIALCSSSALGQTGYEWWLDNDMSGRKSGTFSGSRLDLRVDMSGMSEGLHGFNCRVNRNDTTWGAVYHKTILIPASKENKIAEAYEYWIDDNFDAKQSGSLSAGVNAYTINLKETSEGMHRLNYRVRARNGIWGSTYSQYFLIPSSKTDGTAEAYEYWIDNNYDAKESGSLSAGVNAYTVKLNEMTEGLHSLHYRVRTRDGVWGSIYSQYFLIPYSQTDGTAVAYEYWLDDNYDAKQSGSLSTGSNVYTVDLKELPEGLHRLNYRVRTQAGDWGSIYSQFFCNVLPKTSVSTYEYWLDNDFANRKTGTVEENQMTFKVDLEGFDKSGDFHCFNMRVHDSEKGWGALYRKILVFHSFKEDTKAIGYRHSLNGMYLGYVEIEGGIEKSHTFSVAIPDGLDLSISDLRNLTFNGDVVSMEWNDSIHYTIQVKSAIGWSAPRTWDTELSHEFSTKSVNMAVNSSHDFDVPVSGGFLAVKFTSTGAPLYFRSTVPVALDLYRNGEKIREFAAEETAGIANAELEAGEYFGILHDVADKEAKQFTFHLMDTPDAVPAPNISFVEGMVTITCSRDDAEIYYTLDESDPTAESNRYAEPFALDRNAVVKAIAILPDSDLEPSQIVAYAVDCFKAETPTWSFDVAGRALTLSCSTEGTSIYYSLDPEGNWTEYTGPVAITKNRTLYAKASRDGWNDSDIVEIRITELADNVPAPEISFEDGIVTISCANADTEIHYTIDDPNISADSPLYTEPFRVGHNATVRAFALIPGLDIEPSETVTYTVDYYKVEAPYGEFDSDSMILTIKCATEGAYIFYSFYRNGDWIPYEGPITVDGNGTVYAMATHDGYNDSEIAEIVISDVKCAPVSIIYNGRYVILSTGDPNAYIRYSVDGSDPYDGMEYTGEFDAEGLCVIRAVAGKPGHVDSDVAELTVDRYADEEHAVTSAGGLLASAFEWNGDLPDSIEDFRVEGILDDTDYGLLRSMKSLRRLDMEKVADARIPEGAFQGSGLITVSLPEDLSECFPGSLSGASRLSSVIWNSRTLRPEAGLTKGMDNPNALLYVPAGTGMVRTGASNVVEGGRASTVNLRYGHPYYAARDFRADYVAVSHEFTQTTHIDTCRGWETLILPFEPTLIRHSEKGRIIPFTAWDGDVMSGRPFWLYRANAGGWEMADRIEARVPYIISMPNNPEYMEAYNLSGTVTFAAFDVDLGPESSYPHADSWTGGTQFEGTFMPMDEEGLLSLNVNAPEDGGLEPGSTFVADAVTPPFGAYVRGAGGRKAMPLFGRGSGVDTPALAGSGLIVETPALGMIRISSGRECRVAVTTATGVTIRTLRLKAGEAVTLEGLTRDLYIVAGRKVMVR